MRATVPGVHESQRDVGLIRAVGPWALAASVISMIVGAGIFAVPAALAASVGPYAPLAFLACAFAVGAVAICFAEGGSRVPTSGGVYGLVEAAFGPLTGYIAGTLLWVGCVLACGSVTAALADVVASLFPRSLTLSAQPAMPTATVMTSSGPHGFSPPTRFSLRNVVVHRAAPAAIVPCWFEWKGRDSNPRPRHYQSDRGRTEAVISTTCCGAPVQLAPRSTTEHDRVPQETCRRPATRPA